METQADEVANGIFRLSTYIPEADFTFNQYLVRADEPLLFHCGMRGLFPLVSATLARLVPLEDLRWISFGHWEADESGAMNDWLNAAPHSQVAVGEVGCMISVNDLAIRPPKALAHDTVLDLGSHRVRFLATPHVPHCWDAGLLFEEKTRTLLCGDLFTRLGKSDALSASDPVSPALAAEDMFHATALCAETAPTLHKLAALNPSALAIMHGPVYTGDGSAALRALADGYETRLRQRMPT